MAHRYWPLFDLRIDSADLTLRPMTEADQRAIADLLPGDVELDPAATRIRPGMSVTRGIIVHQAYWNAYATWRPEAWRVSFAASAAGQILGAQELEGNDFPVLRTVDTASFLVPGAGRGFGNQMRRAVLALAFGPMGAQAAITSAWHDNAASLGVSGALGYQPNGESVQARSARRARSWDRQRPWHVTQNPSGKSEFYGVPGDYRSPAVTRHQAGFESEVERDVRDLVNILVERFNWITYSSCAGHEYDGLPIEPVVRQVGMLPRDESERMAIRQAGGASSPAESEGSEVVQVTLVDRELTGAAAPRLAIDLRVMPVPGSTWALYFDWLDDFYHRFLDRLDSLASGM